MPQFNSTLISTLQSLGITDVELATILQYFQDQLTSSDAQVTAIQNQITNLQNQLTAVQAQASAVQSMVAKLTVTS